MKYSAVCSRGNTLKFFYIQRSTVLAQNAIFEVFTVTLIKNEAFCSVMLCRSVHCNDMSEDLVSSKFRILFSDCLNPDKGGSWLLRNFGNFIPIYTQHIPQTNFTVEILLSAACKTRLIPLTLLPSVPNMIHCLQPTLTRTSGKCLITQRDVNLFFLVMNIVSPTTVPFSFFLHILFSILDSKCKTED